MSINHFSSLEFPATLWWSQQQQQHINLMEHDPNYASYDLSKLFLSGSFPNNSSSSSSSPSSPSWPTQYSTNHHQATSWLNPYAHPPPQNPPPPPRPPNFDLNNQNDVDVEEDHPSLDPATARQPLFEKPLTPSDVGKLNRLVIPKQHAEKYFPLAGNSVEKGLLLSFEDELGKCWTFRYSYWNSSQSYVLTKGWSRYVKEKQLDAGDVVLFERHRMDGDRFFIGWRRRGGSSGGVQGGAGATWSRGSYNSSSNITTSASNYIFQHQHGLGRGGNQLTGGLQFHTHSPHVPSGTINAQDQRMPIGNSKRVRLFGVNLECQPDHDQWSEPSTPDGSGSSSMSSQGVSHHHFYSQPAHNSYSSSSPSHMDGISFSRDGNQRRG